MASRIIPFPQQLRPRLPTIVGNVDYLTLQQRLQQIDGLLLGSGVEQDFVERSLGSWLEGSRKRPPSAQEQLKFQERSRRALRCMVLRTLLQEGYRGFGIQLASRPLYQWFCLIDAMDQVRVPSKSELQRFSTWLAEPQIREILQGLLTGASEAAPKLKLEAPLDLGSTS